MGFGIINEIIPEPLGGAHRDPKALSKNIKDVVVKAIEKLKKKPASRLLEDRYKKIRKIGSVLEKE